MAVRFVSNLLFLGFICFQKIHVFCMYVFSTKSGVPILQFSGDVFDNVLMMLNITFILF